MPQHFDELVASVLLALRRINNLRFTTPDFWTLSELAQDARALVAPNRSKAPAAGSSASYGKPHAQDGLVRVRAPLAAGPIHPVCVPARLVAAPDLPARHRPYLAVRRFRPGDRRFRPEVAQVAPGWRWDQARGSSI